MPDTTTEGQAAGARPRPMGVHIRWTIRRDMPFVMEIESFEPRPWAEQEVISTLRRHECIGMVAERGERIVGYMAYELSKFGIEVLRFVVHPDFRRQGVGRQMIEKLRRKLGSGHRRRLAFTVRVRDMAAQLFLRACGIPATLVWPEHFRDDDGTTEDAYRFALVLPKSSPVASPT